MGVSVRATNGCESVCVSLRAKKYSGVGYGTGGVSVNSGCENAFVPKGVGCQLLGTGKSWPILCMYDGQYKQSDWAHGLRSLYVLVPATVETGIQGQLLGRLSV